MTLFGRELTLEQVIGLVMCNAEPDSDLVHRAALELVAALESAISDIKHGDNCEVCKHNIEQPECDCERIDCGLDCMCKGCRDESLWQWRGPQEKSFVSKTIDGVETAVVLWRGPREAREE